MSLNIAIIPARNGSKSIPNKNLQKLGTKTLVERAIVSAKNSGAFSDIILSTDIPTLIEDYRRSNVVSLVERPSSLACDESLMADVVLHAIDKCEIGSDDRIWILQPTSPFRVRRDYHNILEMFESKETRSVISVFNVGANHPNRMYTVHRDQLFPLSKTKFVNKQALPNIFQRSGHFYVFYARDFLKYKNFYIKPCRPYMIDKLQAINIDEPIDLRMAQLLFESGICPTV